MAKKKEEKEKEKDPLLKRVILKGTGTNKVTDALKSTRKAAETADPVTITSVNRKEPLQRTEPEKMPAEDPKKKKKK